MLYSDLNCACVAYTSNEMLGSHMSFDVYCAVQNVILLCCYTISATCVVLIIYSLEDEMLLRNACAQMAACKFLYVHTCVPSDSEKWAI